MQVGGTRQCPLFLAPLAGDRESVRGLTGGDQFPGAPPGAQPSPEKIAA